MNETRRLAVLVTVMFGMLLLTVGWSYLRWSAARDRAERAAGQQAVVQALAEEIRASRRQPAMGPEALDDRQMTVLAEAAADAVGLDPRRVLQSIRAQPDRRIPHTPYRQNTTELRLQGLTLQQFIGFVHVLVSRNPGLRIDAMQLTSPQGTDRQALWTVDPLSVSYLIYAPLPPSDRRGEGGP
jgi:type II secretory pathway pseudopilin PulG